MASLAASDRFELVAICDLREETCAQRKQEYPGIRTFTSHQEMFKACPTDVVCVSTWPPSHKPIALDALKGPLKGILVEKPLGDTTAAGREIVAAVKAKGIPMAVPHSLLVVAHGREILQRVRRGEIGQLALVEIQCAGWDIINAGIHWLNYFVALAGGGPMEFVMAAVDCSTRTYRDGMQVETMAATYAQAANGIRVIMHTGDYVKVFRKDKGALFRLVGTAGVIEFWGWESAYNIVNAEFPQGRLFQVDPGSVKPHQLHLEAMAEQMDRCKNDYWVAESSLIALELCEGAYISGMNRCRVDLPLSGFTVGAPWNWSPGQPYSGTGGGRDGRKLPQEDGAH
jgi:predicted dehydrogenase